MFVRMYFLSHRLFLGRKVSSAVYCVRTYFSRDGSFFILSNRFLHHFPFILKKKQMFFLFLNFKNCKDVPLLQVLNKG
jgi:hypothetical protein